MAKICPPYSQKNPSGKAPSRQADREATLPVPSPRVAAALGMFCLYCLMGTVCQAQSRDVVCRDGTGEFQAEYPTGVRASVRAARVLELASRACDAALSWGDQNLVVATLTSELDIDAFGVDLGVGVPAVAFQVKRSKTECCKEYDIYSLRTPPALLRRITGGAFFSAADTDLDGRIEIWTEDAAAVDGFENLKLNELDFAPPLVLRFQRDKLLDASSEFQSYFDQKIADERAKLNPQDLADFKSSDGQLTPPAAGKPDERLLRLRGAKVKVLEIVWSYLYSGREQQAWNSLAEMWPAADVERIRAALLGSRARGIRSQVDGVSTPIPPGRQMHVKIFDGTTSVAATPGVTPKDVKPKRDIVSPRAILMEREPPSDVYEAELARTETLLKLVIDCAGKVRSVEPMAAGQTIDEGLIKSTSNWKFIPAYSEGEPVASQIFLGVSLKR
jgi:hypothetical protein